jgi:hypothetical protein
MDYQVMYGIEISNKFYSIGSWEIKGIDNEDYSFPIFLKSNPLMILDKLFTMFDQLELGCDKEVLGIKNSLSESMKVVEKSNDNSSDDFFNLISGINSLILAALTFGGKLLAQKGDKGRVYLAWVDPKDTGVLLGYRKTMNHFGIEILPEA